MRRVREKLEGAARGTVIAAVVLSPWLFGSAEPWAYLSICLLVGVGVAVWLLSLLCDPAARLRARGLTRVLLALLVFILVQTLPLPLPVAKVLSPLSAEAHETQLRLFEETGASQFLPVGTKESGGWATISSSPQATRRSLYLFAAYVGAFLVSANTITEWAHLRKAASAIAISSFIMAVFALVQKFSGTSDIYWFHTPRFGGSIFGPFTNRNHYAAYMNLSFGLTLGLLVAFSRVGGFQKLRTWRERFAWLSTREASRITLTGFAAALMAASVCVTLSRGGIASLAAALGVMGTLVALRCTVPNRGWMVATMAPLVVAAVVWLGWQPVVGRLGTLAKVARDPMADSRYAATRDTLRIFAASPALGSGFGSFQYVFPRFESPRIQFGRWLHAHNEYAQLLAEGGLVGAMLTVIAALLFLRTVRRGWAAPADGRARASGGRFFALGATVGLAAIAVHSLIDYSLHKPANAFLLAALCGMSVAAVSIPSRSTRRRTEAVPESHEALLRQLRLRLGAVAGLMVLLVLAAGEVSDLRGELASARFRYFGRLADARRDPKELERAVEAATADAELVLQFDQNNPEAVGETSLTCLDWAGREDLGPLLRLRLGDLAARAGLLAVRAAPSDCDAWLGLARALAALGLQEQADICLERAQSLAPPGTVLRLLPQRVENGGQSSSDGLIVRFAAGERGRRSVGSRTG